MARLLDVIAEGIKYGHAVRIVTLNLACQLVQALTVCPPEETEEVPTWSSTVLLVQLSAHKPKRNMCHADVTDIL